MSIVAITTFSDDIDEVSRTQLRNLSMHPAVCGKIAAMADVHAGLGVPVGAVIPTCSAIIPAAVGVDIGCGMTAVRLSLTAEDLPENLRPIRMAIESAVPAGFAQHDSAPAATPAVKSMKTTLDAIVDRHPDVARRKKNLLRDWLRQIGTLGGGNHFIELSLDENGRLWIMLHSGSRGAGHALASHFIELAQRDMASHLSNLPDRKLAYLTEGTSYFSDYVEAVEWAQHYAKLNRDAMLELVLGVLRERMPAFSAAAQIIDCHHNYVARERHFGKQVYVTRKGAIRAGRGEMGIIPGSMGTASYIVRGNGSEASLESCAHGAGRTMSRRMAIRRFNTRDLAEQTKGVECRKDKGVVDEIPEAYKDIERVMQDQKDLVEVVHRLKAVVCVKG